MPIYSIVLYIIDVILLIVIITFKILIRRKFGGKKKTNKNDVVSEDYILLEDLKALCGECPYLFVYNDNKKRVKYYCKSLEGCINEMPFVPDEGTVEELEEVSENE